MVQKAKLVGLKVHGRGTQIWIAQDVRIGSHDYRNKETIFTH